MKKVTKFGIVALLLVSLVASAFAFTGRGNEAARQALEAGDYTAWKAAKTAELNEENFNKLRERHSQMAEKRAEMTQAMEQGYEAWKEVISEKPRGEHLLEVISEDNFGTFVDMHEAKQNGDYETAKPLAEELGLKGFGRCRKSHFGPKTSFE